jgi:uncharacterized protein
MGGIEVPTRLNLWGLTSGGKPHISINPLSRRFSGGSALTAGLLEIGLQGTLRIREERLSHRPDACRLMYVSDIHLRQGRSENLIRQVIISAQQSLPHAILLGGDLVDRASELGELRGLISSLCEMAPVFAVSGNHDSSVGMDLVQNAVVAGGGKWIHDD